MDGEEIRCVFLAATLRAELASIRAEGLRRARQALGSLGSASLLPMQIHCRNVPPSLEYE
jgi:hypothetical protein